MSENNGKTNVLTEIPEPFFSFPCKECELIIDIFEKFHAGQVAVVECNCGASYSVLSPPLQLFKTEDFPDVWPNISVDPPDWKVNNNGE